MISTPHNKWVNFYHIQKLKINESNLQSNGKHRLENFNVNKFTFFLEFNLFLYDLSENVTNYSNLGLVSMWLVSPSLNQILHCSSSITTNNNNRNIQRVLLETNHNLLCWRLLLHFASPLNDCGWCDFTNRTIRWCLTMSSFVSSLFERDWNVSQCDNLPTNILSRWLNCK